MSSRFQEGDGTVDHQGISSLLATLHEMLGIAAHDISNPLQTVSVLLEVLQTLVEDDHAAKPRLAQADQAGERLRTLVKAFGDLARALPSHERPRDARDIVDAVRGLLSRRCERGRLSWTQTRTEVLVLARQIQGPLHLDVGAFVLGALAATASDTKGTFDLVQTVEADPGPGDISLTLALFSTTNGARVPVGIDASYRSRILSTDDVDRDYGLQLPGPHQMLITLNSEDCQT